MAVSVRKKIWFGTAFLLLLIVLSGGVSIYHVVRLKQEAKEVLKDNYESLGYCHSIQQTIDSGSELSQRGLEKMEGLVRLQEQNITEIGEQQATQQLRTSISQLRAGDTASIAISQIRRALQTIIHLNMAAIETKNARAVATAETNLSIIIAAVALVLLAGFTFSVNFPSVVTNPINHLLEAMEQISKKNYAHRIHIDNKDEFGNLADTFNQMAQRLEHFESSNLNKLMFEKTRAEAVINSLKDASIGIDMHGKVLFANNQALQLLGMKATEMVGKNTDEIARRNDLFSFLLNNQSGTPFKIVVDNKENFFIEETVDVALENAHSKVIMLKNITSFKELDVAKTNFIATISHELKTPLASSDFSLKLLEDERNGHLEAAQKELVLHLKDDNQRMLKILSELLNMAQVETGKIQLNMQFVSPETMVHNALQTVAASAKEKSIQLNCRMKSDFPPVKTDAEKATWVLNNLLSNAIKFSSEHATVSIIVSDKEGRVFFSVEDNGPGIASEYHTRIFDRYFQVPGSKEKGTGLGLSISKDFIEALGGEIFLDSTYSAGAKFAFWLPANSSL